MSEAYYGASNDYRGYLMHHGIKGQKWGVRNGPPYPLDASDHNARERKANWKSSLKKGDNVKKKKPVHKAVGNKPESRLRKYKNELIESKRKQNEIIKKRNELSKNYSSNDIVKKAHKEMHDRFDEIWSETNHNWNEYSEKVNKYRKEYFAKNKNFTKLKNQHEKSVEELNNEEDKITNKLWNQQKEIEKYLETEIKNHSSFKQYQETKQKLSNLYKETLGEDSQAYKDAYNKYVNKQGIDDYQFDHYMWREESSGDYGCKEYNDALKQYQNKSKEYEKILEESTTQIGKDVLDDLFNDKEINQLYNLALLEAKNS